MIRATRRIVELVPVRRPGFKEVPVRRLIIATTAIAVMSLALGAAPARAQSNAPEIPYVSVPNYLKYPPTMNLGETLAVAENSKGHIVVLNHPGSSTSGPLFGNAATNLLEFDDQGNFVREIGQNVYGFGYGHSLRFDNDDNLWVVDKGTNAVTKLNSSGYVVLNLGRRPEGFDEYEHQRASEARQVDGYFQGPTDVGWDPDGNIYVSDGYINSRVGKMDKWGNWLTSWGSYGSEDGQLRLPHNLQVDRQGRVYVADRSNRRIQKYDSEGNLLDTILLNVPYDKTAQPVLGNPRPNLPDNTAPWTLCISSGETQYLFASDEIPGRIYKMTLDGEILGWLGGSGRGPGQFNWLHGISCRDENVLIVADMNNWRVQKLLLNQTSLPTNEQ